MAPRYIPSFTLQERVGASRVLCFVEHYVLLRFTAQCHFKSSCQRNLSVTSLVKDGLSFLPERNQRAPSWTLGSRITTYMNVRLDSEDLDMLNYVHIGHSSRFP